MAAQIVWQSFSAFRVQPESKFAHWGVQLCPDGKHWWGAIGQFCAAPDYVQNNILERGIAIMSVRTPTGRSKIDFHIAGLRIRVADLDHGTLEIRTTFAAEKSRMQNSDGTSIGHSEFVPQQTLMLPDRLQQAFRRDFVVFVKEQGRAIVQPPLRVEIVWNWKHLAAFFAGWLGQSQAGLYRNAKRNCEFSCQGR